MGSGAPFAVPGPARSSDLPRRRDHEPGPTCQVRDTRRLVGCLVRRALAAGRVADMLARRVGLVGGLAIRRRLVGIEVEMALGIGRGALVDLVGPDDRDETQPRAVGVALTAGRGEVARP